MQLEVLNDFEYQSLCQRAYYFFNTPSFHALNSGKTDRVVYLLFKEGKNKLLLAAGITNGEMKVPYSAPFALFEKLQAHISIEEIEDALHLVEEFARKEYIRKITFRIPPSFYDETFISKFQNCVLRNQYKIECCDLNYYMRLTTKVKYEETLFRNAKKNLKRALNENFVFEKCDAEEQWSRAYQVIQINRQRKGYPLRMTYEQVIKTKDLTRSDAFLLKLDETDVAAAIVFQVTDQVVQVIYWGDIDGYEIKRPMNLLSYQLYEYYKQSGIDILDIGPSTEEGIPNYGLCSYKESIGCEVCTKYTYEKILK